MVLNGDCLRTTRRRASAINRLAARAGKRATFHPPGASDTQGSSGASAATAWLARNRRQRANDRDPDSAAAGRLFLPIALKNNPRLPLQPTGPNSYITRSTNSRVWTSTGAFISSRTPRATCSDRRRKASSPLALVARSGLPMTPLSMNSWWSIGKVK